MRLRPAKLQESNIKAQKIRIEKLTESLDGYKYVNRVLHHYRLPFMPIMIPIKFISRHHNNFLTSHFDINKAKELIS